MLALTMWVSDLLFGMTRQYGRSSPRKSANSLDSSLLKLRRNQRRSGWELVTMQQALAETLALPRNAARSGFHAPALDRSSTLTRVQRWAFAGVVLLYLGGVSSQWYLLPDSAVYLLLADSVADGDGYAIAGQPHTKFPPGFPLLLAGLKSVGLGDMLWLNSAMTLMGLATLVVTYKLLLQLAPPAVAMLVTFAVALSHDMYGHSHWQLSEIPFMLLVLTGILSYTRPAKGNFEILELGSLALVASCWFRVVGMPIALAAVVGLVIERKADRRRAVLNAIGVAAGVALTAAYLYWLDRQAQATVVTASYAAEAGKLAGRSIIDWLLQPALHFYATGGELNRLFTGQELPLALALVLLWLPILAGMAVGLRHRKFIGLFVVVAYVGAILLVRPLVSRYLLPLAPLLLLYYFEGLQWLIRCRPRWEGIATQVATAAIICMALINAPKDIRLAWGVHQADEFANYRAPWPAMIKTAEFLRQAGPSGSRFVSGHAWSVLAYLSEVPCYQVDRNQVMHPPEAHEMLAALAEQGVNTVVLEKRSQPQPYFAQLAQVVVESKEFQLVFENEAFQVYSTEMLARPDA